MYVALCAATLRPAHSDPYRQLRCILSLWSDVLLCTCIMTCKCVQGDIIILCDGVRAYLGLFMAYLQVSKLWSKLQVNGDVVI